MPKLVDRVAVRGETRDWRQIVQTLPHSYIVTGVGTPDSDPDIFSDRLPVLRTALPAEFGGTGEQWSPETLLVAAVADCFLLTFRGVSRARQSLARQVLERAESTCLITNSLKASCRLEATIDVADLQAV